MVGENMGNDNMRKGFWDPKQARFQTMLLTFHLQTKQREIKLLIAASRT